MSIASRFLGHSSAVAVLAVGIAGCAADAPAPTEPASFGASAPAEAVPPDALTDLVPGQTIPATDLPRVDQTGVTAGIVVDGLPQAAARLASHAESLGMSVEVFDSGSAFEDALAAAPDVVVCAGGALLPRLESVTAQSLDQRFVLIGMRLLEPTENVAAVIWQGQDSLAVDAAVPTERLGEALTAGVAASSAVTMEIVVDLDA